MLSDKNCKTEIGKKNQKETLKELPQEAERYAHVPHTHVELVILHWNTSTPEYTC